MILVVEDVEDVRKLMAEALTVEGYTVRTAENGADALELLASLPDNELPSCILLDMMMPKMDGLTFLKIVLGEHRHRLGHIPIIVQSAKSSGEKLVLEIPVAFERLNKPIDLDELYERVRKHERT